MYVEHMVIAMRKEKSTGGGLESNVEDILDVEDKRLSSGR